MPANISERRRHAKPMKVVAIAAVMGLVLFAAAADAARDMNKSEPDIVSAVPSAADCTSRSPMSRWVAGSERYERFAVYGHGEDEWLATISGVEVADERVFVYDEGAPAIVELTSALSRVHQFGRRGPGPGEITRGMYISWVPGYWDFSFLGFDGRAVAVYDREEIEVYAPYGTHTYEVPYPDDSMPWVFGLRYVRPDGPGRLLVVTDSLDFADQSSRRLQVWSITGEGSEEARRLLWQIPLPTQEGPAMTRILPREARPFWAGRDGCQVASDGASRFLYRFDRSTARLDSLILPDWEVPRFGDSPEDNNNFSPPGVEQLDSKPSALARWKDLVIDPDGWAWIRAWTPLKSEQVVVFAVSLETGQVVEVETPSFPRAFGDPGVFYSVERDAETEEQLIVRYDASS